jgi:hypothetical protein
MAHKHIQQLERVVCEADSIGQAMRDAADVLDDIRGRELAIVSVAVTYQVKPAYVTVTYQTSEREE